MDAFDAIGYQNGTNLFSNITVSVGSVFDSANSWFLAPPLKPSLYWLHIGADIPASTKANITLNVVGLKLNLLKTHTVLSFPDTVAREGVISLNPLDLIYATSVFSTLNVLLSGFRLDNYFNPLVAFYVGISFSLQLTGYCSFDRVLVNEGNAWNSISNRFVAPYDGIYFLSSSAGLKPVSTIKSVFEIRKNRVTVTQTVSSITALMNQGQDQITRSHLLSLNATDYLQLYIENSQAGAMTSDETVLMASFSGFYYSPPAGQQVRSDHLTYRRILIVYIVSFIINYSKEFCSVLLAAYPFMQNRIY